MVVVDEEEKKENSNAHYKFPTSFLQFFLYPFSKPMIVRKLSTF